MRRKERGRGRAVEVPWKQFLIEINDNAVEGRRAEQVGGA